MTYAVILAGGKGERLWPLSRESKPKQLLPFVNNRSLLENSLDRLDGLIERHNRFIVTNKQQEKAIIALVGNHIHSLFIEPASRNTAPAILLSCLLLAQKNPNAVVVFLPADPYIPETKKFVAGISAALEYNAKHDVITLLGVKPRYPATGYGYIEYKKDIQDAHVGAVLKFHEKPSLEVAQIYCSMQSMLWNIGIFCGRVSVFLREYQKYAPELYAGMQNYILSGDKNDYLSLPSISIDHALMEKSDKIYVVPVDFEWSDVGNLEIFLALQQEAQSKNARGNVIEIDAHNNLISSSSGKMVALLGVDDVCVVETPDALLIVKRSEAEKVKLIVQELKKKNLDQYL